MTSVKCKVFGIGLLLMALCLMAGADTALAFVYKNPSGTTFVVTSDGLNAIEIGGKTVARGDWRLTSLPKAFGGQLLDQSLKVSSPRSVRVIQKQQYLRATYDYSFDGEDVTIRAKVENSHPTETLDIAVFGRLVFDFERKPSGHMMIGRGPTDVAAMHPGHFNKIGGSYATDGVYGVGMSPMNTGFTRTELCWNKMQDNSRGFVYSAQKPIPPGGSDTFWLKIRVSKNTDWHHLLQPYKDHFLATYGPVRYKSDHRFLTQGVLACDAWIKPGNPFGFEQYRRFDLPEGARKYCQEQVDRLTKANGQGTILWAYQGNDPRGEMYRTDFDVMPPVVEANFPIARQVYESGNKRFGLTSRPGQFSYRGMWARDYTTDINPDDTAYLDANVRRFNNSIAKGCSVFYLDSFGNSLKDVKAIKYYREKLGPNVQTFAEMHCDAILPYTGIYTEASYLGGDDPDKLYALAWIDTEFVEICRWMLPEFGSCVTGRKPGPPEAVNVWKWIYAHHLTPLCPDYDFGIKPEEMKKIQDQYVDETGRWRM